MKKRKTTEKSEIADVVLYRRVSTTDQAERDLSLPAQLDYLQTRARERGWGVVRDYVEPGASATDDQRPVFKQMMADLLSGEVKAQAILVYHTSRFMRNVEKARYWKVALKKHGIRVIAAAQETSDDASGRLIEGVFEVFDQYESEVNSIRTSAGLRQCARQGYFPGSRPPFGFALAPVQVTPKLTRRKLVPHADEAQALRELFQLYVCGVGAKGVARDLNQRGLRHRGALWTKDAVLKIVDETAATGRYFYGKYETSAGTWRPESEWLEIKCDAIISDDLFEMAQKVRAERDPTRNPGRTSSSPLLLAHVLKCARCGASYQLETSGKVTAAAEYGYRYYNCRSAVRAGAEKCPGRRVRVDALDAAVLDHLAERLFTPERCKLILKELDEKHGLLTQKTEEQRREIKRELADIEKRLAHLFDAIESGKMPEDLVLDRIRERKARHAELTRTLAKVRPLRAPVDLGSDEVVARFGESVRKIFLEGNALSRNYIRYLVEKIVVDGDEVRIECRGDAVAQMVANGGDSGALEVGVPVSLTTVGEELRRRDSNPRPSG